MRINFQFISFSFVYFPREYQNIMNKFHAIFISFACNLHMMCMSFAYRFHIINPEWTLTLLKLFSDIVLNHDLLSLQ